MKTLLLAATLFTTLSAQASFMYEACGNADSSITTKSGHIRPSVTVTETLPSTDGQGWIRKTELDVNTINIIESDRKIISTKSSGGCREGDNSSYSSTDTISVRKITITNKDGSEFPYEMSGRSLDGLSIEDHFVCKSHVSYRTACN